MKGRNFLLAILVERGEGLVHEEESRVREHRAGEGDPLALPAGERGDAPPEEGIEVHQADHRFRPEHPLTLRGAAVTVEDVPPHREVGEEASVLKDETCPPHARRDERAVVLPDRAFERDPTPRFPLESPRGRRRRVVLPQPEGPKTAVTPERSTSSAASRRKSFR